MTTSRLALLVSVVFILLVACASPTPRPLPTSTLPPQAATPVPTAAATPVAAVPSPVAAVPSPTALPLQPLFAQGITDEPLVVVTTAPADKATEVAVSPDQTKIVVQFNHPVVPLVSVDAQKTLPQPLTITPGINGAGEWINTSTYAFTPAQNLAVATGYSISVAALQDMLGQSLSGFSWSFKTAGPVILKTYPENNTRFAGVSEPITMTFNTDMDRASTESRTSLAPKGNTTPVQGKFQWQGKELRFVPDKPLDYNVLYQVTVKAGAQDVNKVASMVRDNTWFFQTSKQPGVASTSPKDGELSATSIREGFQIDFTSPMSTTAVTVTINPTITNPSSFWDFDQNNTRMHLNGGWLASRAYTVTISGQSLTRYSEKLGKDTVVHFTAAPLDPSLSLNVTGNLGMYDTNVPQTIYASYINLSHIDYSLYKISRSDFLSLTGRNRYQIQDTYTPDPANLLNQWAQDVKAPLNASRLISTTLTLGASGPSPLPPGAYYFMATTPQIGKASPARQLIIVTGVNIALKRTETEALAWVTDLETGKPVANQPLDLYGADGSKLASGTTDGDGILRKTFASQSAWDPIYALSEVNGKIVAAAGSDWSDGINVYDFNLPVQPDAREFYANLYTDRAIYRPGQIVYFRGILRRDNDASYSLPTDVETVPIVVRDDQGKEVFRQNIPLTPYGTFNGQFALSGAASIGFYNLSFELGQDPKRFFASAGFQVAEYRAPEFQVDVKTDKPEYLNGDTIKVDATSAYFFGGPVANAKITWRLLSDDLFFQTDKVKGWWDFVDSDLTTGRRPTGGVIRQGTGTTDAQGKFHVEVPADLKDFPLSQNFTIDIEVDDINNQAVSNRTVVPVHKGNYYIGLRPSSYVGNAGQEQSVDIITVTPQGDPMPNQALTISFYQHNWYSVRVKLEDGNFYWQSAYTDTLISKAEVKTDATGAATAKFTPPTGAVYKIVGEGQDASGNTVRSATYAWITGEGYVNWRIENNDRIDLVADKKSYNVGDTAEVLIPAPFQGAEALLTIERGTIREVKRLTLVGNSQTIKIPIKSDYTPNVFVSVMLVKGRGSDSPTPQFKLGYTNLAVATTEKQIQVKITPDRTGNGGGLPTYGPGDKAGFTLQATDYKNQPVQAEFSLALVDKAIQSLATDTAQSPLDAFYGQRGLGVQTAASLARSVERVNQQLEADKKGGGGGGLAQEPVRRNFQDTAYWKADIVTDASGKASISVPLPDNLTTWNLTAKGVTGADTMVGMGTSDIMSTKPLLVRPVEPRFFVVGDKARLEAVVNNNTDKDITTDVRLDAQGLTLAGNAQQPLTVKAHNEAKVGWDTTVNPVEQAVLKFSATGGEFQDALEQTLPILRPSSPETVATAGQVADKTTEQIKLPSELDPSVGELRVDVSPSLAAASQKSLDYLEAFAYDCSEQTISKFFPNVVTYQALVKLGIDRPDLKRDLQATVSTQVQRLYSLQNQDGGWGWWGNEASQPTLTAYGLYALYTADKAGFAIDSQVIDRARQFLLNNYLNVPIDVKAAPYGYDERAFVLFVLTETGNSQSGNLVSLYDKRTYLDNYGKAFLLMALADSKLSQAAPLATELTSTAIQSATGAHWEESRVDYWTMNTNTRSTAIAIMALARVDPKSATLANAVRWLMVARKDGHWETTQETAWSVLGLTGFMAGTGELNGNYAYQVMLGDTKIGSGAVDKTNIDQTKTMTVEIASLVKNAANDLTISRDNQSGQLYYSAYLRYFLPVDKMQALNKGIIVGRQYYAVDQQTLKPTDKIINSATVGDYVQVRVTLVAPTDLHYLALEDPLPAGFEAVDTTLKTSSAAAQGGQFQKQNPQSGPASQAQPGNDYDLFYQPYYAYWAHSEVHDDKVAVFATYLGRGTYEYSYMMRASVGGEFRALPTNAYEMYFPEVFGRSAGALFNVKP